MAIKFDWALAEQILETALSHPHNGEINPIAPEECLFKNVEYDGELLNIMLTYNFFNSTDKQCWQLSICRSDLTEAKKSSVIYLVLAILGQGTHVELTQYMPKHLHYQRQFMKESDRKFDPVKKEFVS